MKKSLPDVRKEYLEKGDATGWFEEIYSRSQSSDDVPPWARLEADSQLVAWAEKSSLKGDRRSAIVIGCGLGDDAEYLAKLGFKVTAFDISPTAIEICKKRFPETTVTYQQADLFHPLEAWSDGFDFVFENRTIQALPVAMADKSMQAVTNLVADKGQLFILCHGRENDEPKGNIPWSLSREDLKFFEQKGMQQQHFEEYHDGKFRHFLVLYQK